MKVKKNIIKVLLVLIILITAILLYLYISHKRPLYETKEYWATANTAGKSYKVTVYKMLFRPNVLFLYTQIGNNRYQWFTINIEKKIIAFPISLGHIPYLSYNSDMSLGVSIDLKYKVDDEWTSSWENNVIRFSNKKVTITVKRKNKK